MNDLEKENDLSVKSSPPIRPAFLADPRLLHIYSSVLRRILVGLVGSGYSCSLAGPSKGLEFVLCPTVQHIPYPALKLPIFRQKNIQILCDQLERFKPTVLHGFWPGMSDLAARISNEMQIPFVLTFHKILKGKPLSYWSVRQAAAMIAPTQKIADSIRSVMPACRERIHLIPMGCYVEDTCCCYAAPERITSLMTVHPLDHLDEFEPLLQAVRHLALDGFDFLFGMMGSGRAEKAIRSRIRALGLTPRISVVPRIRPIRTMLSGADIFIHVRDQGQCNPALLEAMSVGMAMSGDLDPCGQLLRNQETALIYDPSDELDIYATLKKLLSRKEEARQLAMRGQTYLRKHHRVSRMVDNLIWVYQAIQSPDLSEVSNGTIQATVS